MREPLNLYYIKNFSPHELRDERTTMLNIWCRFVAGVGGPAFAGHRRAETGRVCRGAAGHVLQSATDAESGRAVG